MRRAFLLLAVVVVVPLAGCVEAGIDAIEDARGRSGAGEEESTAPPARAAWPVEGSFVEVEVQTRERGPGRAENASSSTARWEYRDGDWVGACESAWRARDAAGNEREGRERRAFVAEDPPHWPPLDTRARPAQGDTITAWVLDRCELASLFARYEGVDALGRLRAGPVGASQSFDTRWDADTGLVLSWSWERGGRSTEGRVRATDAP